MVLALGAMPLTRSGGDSAWQVFGVEHLSSLTQGFNKWARDTIRLVNTLTPLTRGKLGLESLKAWTFERWTSAAPSSR